MSDNTATVMFCGVGGQGALLAADVLARCAASCGHDVKLSEIHGMAQRGGAVSTVVRMGHDVASMVADLGRVDFLVAFEMTEALRNREYLRPGGTMIVNDESIKPLPVLTGRMAMPARPRKRLADDGARVIPAQSLALQAGSAKAVNVVLLGALSTKLAYPEETWRRTISQRVPKRFEQVNQAAFEAGRAWALRLAEQEA